MITALITKTYKVMTYSYIEMRELINSNEKKSQKKTEIHKTKIISSITNENVQPTVQSGDILVLPIV